MPSVVAYCCIIVLLVGLGIARDFDYLPELHSDTIKAYAAGGATFHLAVSVLKYAKLLPASRVPLQSGDIPEILIGCSRVPMDLSKNVISLAYSGAEAAGRTVQWAFIASAWVASIPSFESIIRHIVSSIGITR